MRERERKIYQDCFHRGSRLCVKCFKGNEEEHRKIWVSSGSKLNKSLGGAPRVVSRILQED